MEISNSLLYEPMNLKSQDKIMLRKYLKNNKVMKIALRNVAEEKQINFILKYFTRIQFFGLDRVRNIHLQTVARDFISKVT